MSVYAAVIDFHHPPLAHDAAVLLNQLPDHYFEPVVSQVSGPVSVAVKMHRVTPESEWEVQPLVKDHIVIVADCRLDNRDELVSALKLDPDSNYSDPDLIYFAYRCWNSRLTHYLRGDYSVVIFDASKNEVLAFVDHFSSRRLFYRVVGTRLFISNQLVRLRRTVTAPANISAAWAANFVLRAGYLLAFPRDLTLIEEIRQLAWGQYMIVTAAGRKIEEYWKFSAVKKVSIHEMSDADVIGEARRLFRQAVSRRLRTRNPVACHLSGGFDSSSTAVTALDILGSGSKLTCLHYEPKREISVPQWQVRVEHERERILALKSQYPQLDIHFFSGVDWPFQKVLSANLEFADMPLANAANHSWITEMAEFAAQERHQVILSGSMGNYTLSLDAPLDGQRWVAALRGSIKYRSSLHACQAKLRKTLLSSIGRQHLYEHGVAFRGSPRQRLMLGFMAAKGLDLESVFKNAFGVEHWIPVADFDFASFIWSLPKRFFCNAQGTKRMVREMMKGYLPDRVMDQNFRGVQSPDAFAWYCDEVQTLRDYFSGPNRSAGACWNGASLHEYIHQEVGEQKKQEDIIVSVLGCYSVSRLREHIEQASW